MTGDMVRSVRCRFWVVLVTVGILASACGGDSDTVQAVNESQEAAEPTDDSESTDNTEPEFPLEFFGRTLPLESLEEIEGGQKVNIVGELLANGVVRAEFDLTLLDLRVEGGSVDCSGETHEGPFTVDTDRATPGTVSIADWGIAELEFTRTVTVFNSALGAPFCDEQTGTWTGNGGAIDGMSGTVHRVRKGETEKITLSL